MKYNKNVIIPIVIIECVILAFSLILNEVWSPLIIFSLVITLLLTVKKPIWGLLLFILFMFPSRVLPITTGVTILKLLFLIALGTHLINCLRKGEITLPKIHKTNLAILIVVAIAIASLIYCRDIRYGLGELFAFLSSVLAYFLIISMVTSVDEIRLIQQCLMISAVINALFMLLAWQAEGFHRIGAFEMDPNFFALSLTIAVPIAINEFLISRSKLWKTSSLIIFFLVIFAVLITFSRGGLITLIVVLFFMTVKNKKSFIFVLGVLIIIGIGFNVFLGSGLLPQEHTNVMSLERIPALVMRYSAIRSALHVFLDHPIFGVGTGNFILYYNEYSLFPPSAGALVAHNMYLEILADLGIIGFIPFVLIIIYSVIATIEAQRIATKQNDFTTYRLIKTCQGMLLTFLIGGLFLNTQSFKYFWIALALSVLTKKISSKAQLDHAGTIS